MDNGNVQETNTCPKTAEMLYSGSPTASLETLLPRLAVPLYNIRYCEK